MLVQIKQDTSSKEPCYTVGSTILPWKSSIPVWRSLRKKRNGWSAMNWNSLMRGLRLRYPLILTAVTAAAVVPCSSTSIIAFWITWAWNQWKLFLEPKIRISQKMWLTESTCRTPWTLDGCTMSVKSALCLSNIFSIPRSLKTSGRSWLDSILNFGRATWTSYDGNNARFLFLNSTSTSVFSNLCSTSSIETNSFLFGHLDKILFNQIMILRIS